MPLQLREEGNVEMEPTSPSKRRTGWWWERKNGIHHYPSFSIAVDGLNGSRLGDSLPHGGVQGDRVIAGEKGSK